MSECSVSFTHGQYAGHAAAQFQTFMSDMNQRRTELGLPPMGQRPLSPR